MKKTSPKLPTKAIRRGKGASIKGRKKTVALTRNRDYVLE